MGKKAEYGYAVTWKDKTVYYDSEEKCLKDLKINHVTLWGYINKLRTPRYGMEIRKYKISGEEKLLRNALRWGMKDNEMVLTKEDQDKIKGILKHESKNS